MANDKVRILEINDEKDHLYEITLAYISQCVQVKQSGHLSMIQKERKQT